MTLGQLAPPGFGLGFGGMLVLTPFLALNTFRILRRLRDAHPTVWEGLGSPALVMNSSLQNHRAMRRWTRERQYEELNDPVLAALIARERVLGHAHAAFGVIAGVSFVGMLATP